MANEEKMKTMIGGQALIEGILMRGPDKDAIVLRKEDGLDIQVTDRTLPAKNSVKTYPLIRGVVNFFDAQRTGIRAIFKSSEDEQDTQEPGKFEKWLTEKIGSEKVNKLIYSFAMIFGIGFSVVLFFLIPMIVGEFFENLLVKNLVEGATRIVVFVGYMLAIFLIPEMKRVYGYHGAEHKTIRCYEAKQPLTVENVREHSRLHPRCGTSFLLIVCVISILLFSLATFMLTKIPFFTALEGTFAYRLVMIAFKLLLIPVVVALGYEFNRFVGRHDNWFTRALSAPGMWFQKMTTCEPDDGMIEVAIAALEAVIPEQEGADQW